MYKDIMDQDPFEALQEAGVLFTPVHPIALKSYIKELQQGALVEWVPYCSVSLAKSVVNQRATANDRLGILPTTRSCGISWHLSDVWKLQSWLGHPGPIESDFIAIFNEIDNVYESLFDFYFGSPVIINGWVVPLHHHPELDQKLVEAALLQAKVISPKDFSVIQEGLVAQANTMSFTSIWERGRWERFLTLKQELASHRTCYLRRNMSAAYIVDDRVG